MKTLLHICCGPCSLYCIDALKEENIEMTGLFANPNIHPFDEYLRRMQSTRQACALKGIPLEITDRYEEDRWLKFAPDDKSRCIMCYETRLTMAADYCVRNGFDNFTTTLLVSPYQQHDLIREIGERIAAEKGTKFLYRDFRPGFRDGQSQARLAGMYRQKYCGCIHSVAEGGKK